MEELKKALMTLLRREGIESAVLQNKAMIIWKEVVGEMIAKEATAEDIKHGTLVVRTTTPVWRNELVLRKGEIVKKLNNALGKRVIRDIKLI